MVRISSIRIPRGRDFWAWPPVVVGLGLASALLVVSAGRIMLRERAVARERAMGEEKIRALQAEKVLLEEAIGAIADPETIERLAKAQLNLKNPEEEVVVVVPARGGTSAPPRSGSTRFGWFTNSWLGQLFGFLIR